MTTISPSVNVFTRGDDLVVSADLPGIKPEDVHVDIERIWPNCPRYIHRMTLAEHSVYAPRDDYVPPVPEWKRMDFVRDVLPEQA